MSNLGVVNYNYVHSRRVAASGVIDDDIFTGLTDGDSQKFNRMFNLHQMQYVIKMGLGYSFKGPITPYQVLVHQPFALGLF